MNVSIEKLKYELFLQQSIVIVTIKQKIEIEIQQLKF